MPKDGNCLFHAMASLLEHPSIRHDTLRRMLVHYIYQNADKYNTDILAEGYADINHYCENMTRDKFWGDGTVLQAFAMLFEVTVYVYYRNDKTPTCLREFNGRPTLALILEGNHYDRVLSVE